MSIHMKVQGSFSVAYLNAKARKDSGMKIKRSYRRGMIHDIHWQELSPELLASLPKQKKQDLLDTGSLTQSLIKKSRGQFHVEVVNQGLQRPQFSEWRRLGLKNRQLALVRSVKLYGNEQVWILARSVIPISTLRGKTKFLAHLGSKPLGAVLFKDPSLDRALFEISRLTSHQLGLFKPFMEEGEHWGRRSVFFIRNKPLLVAEVFLNNCPQLS